MIRLLASLLLLLLLPLLAVAVLLVATLQPVPLVSRGATIAPASVAEARSLLASNDPRRLRRGDERTAQIPGALLDEALNPLASRSLGARGAFALVGETAEIRFSVAAPGVPGPRYLNLRVSIKTVDGQPRIASASLGSLPIPPLLADWLVTSAIDHANLGADWLLARQTFRRLSFAPASGTVAVSYVWQPGLLDRARSMAFTPTEVSQIEAAQRALASLLERYPARARVPLGEVLSPLLAAAGTAQQGRAALLVLAIYLSEKSLSTLLPAAQNWPRARRVDLTLLGRYDSAQHFTISAALAAWAGEPAANAIGVYKELDDSRGGSGFSFADLAADRAGTRFGELIAANSPRLRQALRSPLADVDLAPSLAGLPEHLSEAEFRRRYGSSDSAAYQQVNNEVERRVAALPLYR